MFRTNLDAGAERAAHSMVPMQFVEAAERGDAETTIADAFDGKLAEVRGGKRGRAAARIQPLLDAAREAHAIWQQRGRLSRRENVLLAAALLYFISPLDAVPDVVPVLGYADDLAVLVFVLGLVRQAFVVVIERVQKNVDLMLEKLERSADRMIDRAVTASSIGFWTATSVAAISLVLEGVNHGLPPSWQAYRFGVVGLALVWNGAVVIDFYRQFKKLDAPWRERMVDVVTARLGWRHALRIGFPLVLLLALWGLRVFAV